MAVRQKMAFAAGLVAAIVGAGAVLLRPPAAPPGAEAGAKMPVLLTELQRRLFVQGEELQYRIDVNGVQVGSLRSVVPPGDQGADRPPLVLEYEVQPVPTVDSIWRFSASGRSVMNPATLVPHTSDSTTRKGDREKTVSTTLDHKTGIATVTKWDSDTGETERKEVRFDLGLDVPAAFLFLRISKMPPGSPRKLTVLKGDDRYEATFTAVGTGPVEVKAGAFDAIEVELYLHKLQDEGEGSEQGEGDYREVRLWLSEQGRVPLKIESPILGGKLRAELVARK